MKVFHYREPERPPLPKEPEPVIMKRRSLRVAPRIEIKERRDERRGFNRGQVVADFRTRKFF